MTRCLILLGMMLGSIGVVRAESESVPEALTRYVNRPESAYAWKRVHSAETPAGAVHRLELTSQTWHGIVWKHALQIHEPREIRHPRHMLLFVTGGRIGGLPKPGETEMGLKLAQLCGARVATLHQVPNQPLLPDRVEDDLITETWLRYLDTGDESWPLLFAMVKSAVKAMDALEEFAQEEWQQDLDGFVITGASKRGWTSWLTPVADARIKGTAPIVIDVLNFRAQMRHQLETWGEYSEQIIDYTSKGLVRRPDEAESEREIQLRKMMDPYTYREKVQIPKLLIVGTNDRYWVVDAMNIYWDDLPGPKYIRQVPNAGHSLKGGRDGALTTLGMFFRHVAADRPFPKIDWSYAESPGELALRIKADQKPREVRLWTARSSTKDFREATWTSESVTGSNGDHSATVAPPNSGHVAMFGEVEFELDGIPFSLTTLVYRK